MLATLLPVIKCLASSLTAFQPFSNIEHSIPQLLMNRHAIRPSRRRTRHTRRITKRPLKHILQIPPASLTQDVGMVRWGTDAHRLGRA